MPVGQYIQDRELGGLWLAHLASARLPPHPFSESLGSGCAAAQRCRGLLSAL